MYAVRETLSFLIFLTKLTKQRNSKPAYYLFLVYYAIGKLAPILKMDLKIRCIPTKIFSTLATRRLNCDDSHVDGNLYVLCNSEIQDKSVNWFFLCNRSSLKKYAVAVIFTDDIEQECVYVTESMKLNLTSHFKLKNSNLNSGFFLVPGADEQIAFAREMKVSMMSKPHDTTSQLINNLLQSYFSTPKYLRTNDVFEVDVGKYAPETKYCIVNSKLDTLHFKVNAMVTKDEGVAAGGGGSFVVYGQTTLLQEADLNAYLPRRCPCDVYFDGKIHASKSWPPALAGPLEQLQSCIAPFLQNTSRVDVKPMLLLQGPSGSGKHRLVRTASETLGLNFLEADLAEVQSLTSAQTEAKLRIILHDAELCRPCVLMLRNIQTFGVDAEGRRDERVLAAFEAELRRVHGRREPSAPPLIIVATSVEPDVPADAEKTFVETITVGPLARAQRSATLAWHVASRGMEHRADLDKVAAACADFALADLEALVMHAAKQLFRRGLLEGGDAVLSTGDFDRATEYMQSTFAEQIGAPRVPRVRWEDVGGLAELKREITQRVELALLDDPGLGGKSGLLLYGPPGTGKTLLAKAVATECQLHFLSVKGPELLSMYVGQSERNVRQVFERARAAEPCVVFFDELDSLAPVRGRSGDSAGVMDRVVSQLLAEMDGLEAAGRVLVVAATNRPDLVDPALLRPGRFDRLLYVGVCADPRSRLGVLEALTRRFDLAGGLLAALLAELPENLTGADLYSVCSGAWLRAARRLLAAAGEDKEALAGRDVAVGLEDLLCAGRDLVPSVSRAELLRYEKLRAELSSR